MDQHYSPWAGQCHGSRADQCHSSMLQLSFIQKIKENTSSRHEGMPTQKTPREERERPTASERPSPGPWLLSLHIFSSPWLCLLNWESQEYLRSSFWSLDLPLFYFRGILPFLSFSHHHSGLLFPQSTYLTIVNNYNIWSQCQNENMDIKLKLTSLSSTFIK